MTISEPCVVYDMDEADYHADPCPEPSLSSTMAKTIIEDGGPARLQWLATHPRQHKREFDVGHAAHEKVLGRGQGVVIIPDQYMTDTGHLSRKAEASRWIAAQRAAGVVPITAADMCRVNDMAEALLLDTIPAEYLTRGRGLPEVSMFTIDTGTGEWMRGRIDFLADRKTIVDYKTSGVPVGAGRDKWERHAAGFGYHVQAAYYLRMAVALDLVDPDCEFVFVAQEKDGPYLSQAWRASDEFLAEGHRLVDHALQIWHTSRTTDSWPRYPATLADLHLPYYMTRDTEAEAIADLAAALIDDLEGIL